MSEPAAGTLEGTVAIVGFPNVGKSTLVNRLTATRQAVVHETQGTTRDRKELLCEWNGKQFLLIDTGGVDIADPSPITRQIAEQARAAIAEVDLVLFVVDARIGVTPGDEELAQILRESKKPVLVLANKIDDPSQESLALEFHRLGFGEPFPVSGLHGSNTGDLLDEILDLLPGESSRTLHDDAIRVAILGRPNVGKSSLYNRLVGEERTIVSEIPGTTRDTIDTMIQRGDRTFQLVDTAGLRRKRKQRQGIEYYSELRALEAAQRADIALVLIDASQGIVEGDITAIEVARKAHCATLIVLAKWDISEVTIEEVRPELQRRLRQRPDFITVSSVSGRGISRLLDKVTELYDRYAGRVSTADLNRLIAELKELRQAPAKGQRRLNLLYGAQVTTRPPRFRFTVNDPGLVTRDYGYWVENQLRERLGLEGVPVVVDFRQRVLVRAIVVGAGSWGTAFAHVLRERRHDVVVASRDTLDDAPYADTDLVVLAVPSHAFRDALGHVRGDAPVLSLAKGLDPATGERLSTLVGDRPVAVLSGPNMADEVLAGLPGATVIASADEELAVRLQHALNSLVFRVYVNTDLVGVELCGAAKNVIALAAGGVDGLGLGDNAKTALITRGLVEMARLGEAFGAQPETFSGLAGMGDLMVTCFHPSGRNRRAGELIARGATPDEARAAIGHAVEGLTTAPVLRDLSRRIGVELPITEGVCAVLEGMPLHELAETLMGRRPTEE